MADVSEHAQAGIAAINEKRYDDAIASFRAALALAPDRPDMNSALGMAHMHRGDIGGGIPYLENAKTLSDAYPDADHAEMKVHFFTSLATAYQLMDRTTEARDVLLETVTRFPSFVEPRLQLGQLMLESCAVEEGIRIYAELADHPGLDAERQEAAKAISDSARAFLESDDSPSVFLEAHRDSYAKYFTEIAATQPGWYAEAARMARGPGGEPQPYLPDGAKPYALIRVDLVNPENGEVAGIYSETEPMIVAVNGLEPLAQLQVLFPWDDGREFSLWVASRCPWHWLQVIVQLSDPEAGAAALDETIGSWYLSGYNGDFGTADEGRFHYVTDPEEVGNGGIAYAVDLGRARFAAIGDLLNRLSVLHERHPIRRVLLGGGRLPA